MIFVPDIHAQPRKKTPVDRPLRKPYITCARVKKILKLIPTSSLRWQTYGEVLGWMLRGMVCLVDDWTFWL